MTPQNLVPQEMTDGVHLPGANVEVDDMIVFLSKEVS
jgi:hypothetical protein